MNNYIVWDKIYEDLKSSFSKELFGLLFASASLVYLTNEKLVIQVDAIAYSFLQDEATLNYQKFVLICRAHLGQELKIRIMLPNEDVMKPQQEQQIQPQFETTADFAASFLNTQKPSNSHADSTLIDEINEPPQIEEQTNEQLLESIQNDSFKQNLIDNHNSDVDLGLDVAINEDSFELSPEEIVTTAKSQVSTTYADTKLNRAFSFKNYFYSHENQKIIRACQEIVKSLDNPSFNPVFIYGESGIGKTHLINALGNEIFDHGNSYNILYTTGPNFMSEYTNLFKGGLNNVDSIDKFKEKYYNLDVLIIDDIQLLEGKETTLNEFFSIFENLLHTSKQVIITADKKPEDIQFEQRLITRFLSGLTLEIRTPDSDTKKQIFNYYANEKELDVDEDAIQIFIDNSNSVRALIGYINTIHMHFINDDLESSSFTKMDALEVVNKNTGNVHNYTPREIVAIVANHFEIDEATLKLRSRKQEIVTARAFAAYFLHLKLKLNYSAIAGYIGVKEHTSAMRAIKRIEEQHSTPKYKDDFIKVSNKLNR